MRYLNTINKWTGIVITVIFSAMVLIIFAQVVYRYVLVLPLEWSEEVARYLFIWLIFLGSSVAFSNNSHITVTFLVDSIKSMRARGMLLIVADLFNLIFLGMYVWYGFDISHRIVAIGQTSPSMEWLNVGFVFLAIPIGSVFMILNVLAHAFEHVHIVKTGTFPEWANTMERTAP